MKWFDFHVHTKYSYDSLMNIKKMIKIAKRRNLSGFAIVDHDFFSKFNLLNDLKKIPDDFLILFGMEIKTNWGDLIALNITEEIKSKNFLECIDEIKEKDGISILPHPYHAHNLRYLDEMVKEVDWIEIWNARRTMEENKKALNLKNKKPYTVGSDAHLYREIGICKMGFSNFYTIEDIIKNVENRVGVFERCLSPRRVHYYSVAIGTVRTGQYKKLINSIIYKMSNRGGKNK